MPRVVNNNPNSFESFFKTDPDPQNAILLFEEEEEKSSNWIQENRCYTHNKETIDNISKQLDINFDENQSLKIFSNTFLAGDQQFTSLEGLNELSYIGLNEQLLEEEFLAEFLPAQAKTLIQEAECLHREQFQLLAGKTGLAFLEAAHQFSGKMSEKIYHLESGEACLVRSGDKSHAEFLLFLKNTDGTYDICLFNAQKGSEQGQGGLISSKKTKVQFCKYYASVPLEALHFYQETGEKTCNSALISDTIIALHTENQENGEIDCLSRALSSLRAYQSAAPRYLEHFVTAQRSGNCVVKSYRAAILGLCSIFSEGDSPQEKARAGFRSAKRYTYAQQTLLLECFYQNYCQNLENLSPNQQADMCHMLKLAAKKLSRRYIKAKDQKLFSEDPKILDQGLATALNVLKQVDVWDKNRQAVPVQNQVISAKNVGTKNGAEKIKQTINEISPPKISKKIQHSIIQSKSLSPLPSPITLKGFREGLEKLTHYQSLNECLLLEEWIAAIPLPHKDSSFLEDLLHLPNEERREIISQLTTVLQNYTENSQELILRPDYHNTIMALYIFQFELEKNDDDLILLPGVAEEPIDYSWFLEATRNNFSMFQSASSTTRRQSLIQFLKKKYPRSNSKLLFTLKEFKKENSKRIISRQFNAYNDLYKTVMHDENFKGQVSTQENWKEFLNDTKDFQQTRHASMDNKELNLSYVDLIQSQWIDGKEITYYPFGEHLKKIHSTDDLHYLMAFMDASSIGESPAIEYNSEHGMNVLGGERITTPLMGNSIIAAKFQDWKQHHLKFRHSAVGQNVFQFSEEIKLDKKYVYEHKIEDRFNTDYYWDTRGKIPDYYSYNPYPQINKEIFKKHCSKTQYSHQFNPKIKFGSDSDYLPNQNIIYSYHDFENKYKPLWLTRNCVEPQYQITSLINQFTQELEILNTLNEEEKKQKIAQFELLLFKSIHIAQENREVYPLYEACSDCDFPIMMQKLLREAFTLFYQSRPDKRPQVEELLIILKIYSKIALIYQTSGRDAEELIPEEYRPLGRTLNRWLNPVENADWDLWNLSQKELNSLHFYLLACLMNKDWNDCSDEEKNLFLSSFAYLKFHQVLESLPQIDIPFFLQMMYEVERRMPQLSLDMDFLQKNKNLLGKLILNLLQINDDTESEWTVHAEEGHFPLLRKQTSEDSFWEIDLYTGAVNSEEGLIHLSDFKPYKEKIFQRLFQNREPCFLHKRKYIHF